MKRRTGGPVGHRLGGAGGVAVLFAVSVASLRQANGWDEWQDWTWRVIGVTAGVVAVNVLIERLRLIWGAAGRHAARSD